MTTQKFQFTLGRLTFDRVQYDAYEIISSLSDDCVINRQIIRNGFLLLIFFLSVEIEFEARFANSSDYRLISVVVNRSDYMSPIFPILFSFAVFFEYFKFQL